MPDITTTRRIEKSVTQKTLPYTFARVSVMRSKLLKKDEYYKLLKMDTSSITRYLQDSQYKNSITRFSTMYKGMELMDKSLRRHQRKMFDKLRMISPESVVNVIDLYLARWDFQNDKVVMRGIYSGATREEVEALIEPIGRFDKEHFMKLFETGSVEKVVKNSKLLDDKVMQQALEDFKKNNRLIKIENQLDKEFYRYTVEGAAQLSEFGEEFKRFILRKIDMLNIKNLMRFKREGMASNEIMDYLIFEGERLKTRALKKLANTSSYKNLIRQLQKTYYDRYVKFNEESSVFEMEMRLQNYYMNSYSLKSRVNAMSIDCVLAYMLKKVIEVKNLRFIFKGKHLGISEDYIEKKLLITEI